MKVKKSDVVIEMTEQEKKVIRDFNDVLHSACDSFNCCDDCPVYNLEQDCPVDNNLINKLLYAFHI